MKYDFLFITDYFKDYNVTIENNNNEFLEITLEKGTTICFHNAENENDSLIVFIGGLWHCHDDLIFSDINGFYTELNYIDFLSEIINGNILICSRYVDGKIIDIYPLHKDYFNEFKYMQSGEELRIKKLKIEKKIT